MRGMINLLGPLYVRVFRRGASEVKSIVYQTVDDSTTRATVISPTSGKKIRVTSVDLLSVSATQTIFEVYFDTGAALTTDTSKAIATAYLDKTVFGNAFKSWPDGGGPVGAVDEVLSLRTQNNIAANALMIVHYREE